MAVTDNRHTGRVILELIDRYIDGIYRSVGSAGGVFGAIGPVVNVVICGLGGIAATVGAIRGEVSFFLPLLFVPLELLFVRILIRARRGDFTEG